MATTLALLFGVGCGSAEPEPEKQATFLDRLTGDVPETIRELGLYPDITRLDRVHPRAVEYRPAYELWANGSEKRRYLVLPPGSTVNTRGGEAWQFPIGTLFLKSFFYDAEDGAPFPVETRVLQQREDGWKYAVYLWEKSGSGARLQPRSASIGLPIQMDGQEFIHTVPAEIDCRKCHESQASPVIGFDELRLNAPFEDGQQTQLEQLARLGILDAATPEPRAIDHPDELTRSVLGYLQGNCVHCHNGGDGASAAFDMRYPTALENLILREAEGEAISGIRVVPGDPAASLLYQVLTRDETLDDVQPMPPIGVERVDRAALELIEQWILALDTQDPRGELGE